MTNENEDGEITWDQATDKVATELMKHFTTEMGVEANRFFSGQVEGVYQPSDWFFHILQSCEDEDLRRFNAHGIMRGNEKRQLQVLLLILTSNEIIGDIDVLKGSGYADAYVQGGFTLISLIDQKLRREGGGLNIGVIVVNPYFTPLIPTLTKNFPQHHFIKAEEFPKWLAEQKRTV